MKKTTCYKIESLTYSSRKEFRPELLDWAFTKKQAFEVIKKETGLTPEYSYSTFCKRLVQAREDFQKSSNIRDRKICLWVGQLTHLVQVTIQL